MGHRSHKLSTAVAGGSPAPPNLGGGSILDRIWVHVAAYAFLLAAITAIIPLDASFGGDDGAYGGQVHALERGSWELERPVAVVPTENEGWLNTAITDDGPLPYTSNPAYALLLTAMPGDGSLGLQLVPLFGALGSAAAAWAVARALRPTAPDAGAATLAFWTVALGPVLVNSTTLWAHTASTAVGGLSILALLQLRSAAGTPDPSAIGWWCRAAPALLLAGTLLAASLLRTEAIFWIAAVGATAAIGVTTRITRVAAITAVVLGLGTWFVNRSWGHALRADRLPIDTAVVAPEDTGAWLASRMPAAWRLLLTSLGGGLGPLIALAALSFSIAAATRIRRSTGHDGSAPTSTSTTSVVSTALLLASAGTYLLHSALAPGETISGTVAAWPIVSVLLIVGWPRRGSGERHVVLLGRPTDIGLVLVPAILFTVAVLVTQYSLSGGHQWGGRYLSMAFVPLAAVAAVVGWPVLRSRQHRAGLLAVLLAPAIVGTIASAQLHNKHQNIVADTTAIPADVVVTEVIALPRIAWTALPTAYYVADEESVQELLGLLAAAGVDSVNVHGLDDTPLDGTAGYRLTDERGSIRHLQLQTG